MPRPVYEAVLRYYDELRTYADCSWWRWLTRREEARARVAKLLNASPKEIAFTSSTSSGMNFVAELLAGRGQVLTNSLEFPSTTLPWIQRRAKLKFLKPHAGVVSIKDISAALTPQTKLILMSFVQFRNGFRQDLKALGNIKGHRFLVVNATQGFGVFPINVRNSKIDFLVANTYKWFMAGYGGGILFLKRQWLRRFEPQSVGWRSVAAPDDFDNRQVRIKKDASRYELGCPSFPQIFAIGAACQFLTSIGLNQIQSRILHLTHILISELKKNDFEVLSPEEPQFRSGIVVFKVKNPKKVTKQLLTKRIYVSPRGGGIRAAPHIYNTEQEIMKLIHALKEVAKT
jgi:cysteine desulfurase / selenocysteine lyase